MVRINHRSAVRPFHFRALAVKAGVFFAVFSAGPRLIECAEGGDGDVVVVESRVVDGDGNAVEDALVALPIRPGPNGVHPETVHGVTDETGYCRLEVPKDWLIPRPGVLLVTLWAYKPGYALGTKVVAHQLHHPDENLVDLVSLVQESDPEFRILDEMGNAVRDARVEPRHYHTSYAYEYVPHKIAERISGRTDEVGLVTMRAIEARQLFRVLVHSPAHGTQAFRVDHLPEGGVLEVREAVPLKGRVVGLDPQLVRDIPLFFTTNPIGGPGIRHAEGEAEVVTDAAGRFAVAKIASGQLTLRGKLPSELSVRLRFPEHVNLPMDEELVVEIVPATKARGRVVRKDDGTPVVGAEVAVRHGNRMQSERTTTNEKGEFECRVLPGPVFQQVIRTGDRGLTSVGSSPENRFDVPPTDDVDDVVELPTIELVQTYEQPGRLVDGAGNAMVGFRVWAVRENRRYGFATTNDGGEFVMRLPLGLEMKTYRFSSLEGGIRSATVETLDPLQLRAD